MRPRSIVRGFIYQLKSGPSTLRIEVIDMVPHVSIRCFSKFYFPVRKSEVFSPTASKRYVHNVSLPLCGRIEVLRSSKSGTSVHGRSDAGVSFFCSPLRWRESRTLLVSTRNSVPATRPTPFAPGINPTAASKAPGKSSRRLASMKLTNDPATPSGVKLNKLPIRVDSSWALCSGTPRAVRASMARCPICCVGVKVAGFNSPSGMKCDRSGRGLSYEGVDATGRSVDASLASLPGSQDSPSSGACGIFAAGPT